MIRAKVGIALLLITALVVCAVAGAWKYFSDEAAWAEMDRSLIRLQSGIRYEAIINVQSRLADADAATREYSSKWRLFPIGYRKAAPAAEHGIAEIEEALQWEKWAASEGGEDSEPSHLEELVRYPEVFERVKLGCDGPAVKVDPSAVTTVFLKAGLTWIEAARGGGNVKANLASVPNLEQKYNECSAAFVAAKKATAEKRAEAERIARQKQEAAEAEWQTEVAAIAAKKAAAQAAWQKRWASFVYRVVFRSACENYDAIVDGQPTKPIRTSEGSDYFGVLHSMYVKSHCGQIGFSSVQINGHRHRLSWKPDDSGGWLAWVIQPQK
jgi:hypothetical protein